MGRASTVERSVKLALGLVIVHLSMACGTSLHADTLTIGGTINQSTQDGTGPAVNNPSLNNISDGDFYNVELNFVGSITSPGTYDLTGFSLLFRDSPSNVSESSFNSVTLTVAQSGSFDQLSILACLSTGSACNQGNELDLNFMIPAGSLNEQNIVAQGIPNLLPLDLLEDDGVTDIHGLTASYSYTSASPVPEPKSLVFAAFVLIAIVLKQADWRLKT